MKNEILLLTLLVLGTVYCSDGFQFFDSKGEISFDNVKVNLKKIQKKQPESPESPKESQKQALAQKSQKELLAEQLQQIERYQPTNVTIQGGRVFTQSQMKEYEEDEISEQIDNDENDEQIQTQNLSDDESVDEIDDDDDDEDDNDDSGLDDVLYAITQIDQDAQYDAIEFIFKKRQIDYERMKNLLILSNNEQIFVTLEQISDLSVQYQFTKLFNQAMSELNFTISKHDFIEEQNIDQIEYSDSDEDEQTNLTQDLMEPDLQFDDLIEFDNDEIDNLQSEEQIQQSDDDDEIDWFDTDLNNDDLVEDFVSNFNFEEGEINGKQIINDEEISIDEEFEEELKLEILDQKLELNLKDFDFIQEEQFEELYELSSEEEEEEVLNQQVIQDIDPINTSTINLDQPTIEETSKQQIESLPETSFIQIKKDVEEVEEVVLTKEEQQKTYINDTAELIDQDFQETIQSQDIKIEKEFEFSKKVDDDKNLQKLSSQFNLSEETLKLINEKYESMDHQYQPQIIESQNNNFDSQVKLIQMSQQTQEYQEVNQNKGQDEMMQSQNPGQNFLSSKNEEENEQKVQIPEEENEQKDQIPEEEQKETIVQSEKAQVVDVETKVEEKPQASKQQKQIPQSKPAQPAEVEFETPKKIEKSDEEKEKEKELKAKARFAKRYQALDIGNEKQQKKEQDETHFVKVEQNIDDIFIIQSLTSSKKNNVVEISNLNQPPKTNELTSTENENQNNIQAYNSVTEQQLKKISGSKTQHFVEAFVQDMSLKSYNCDPGYYGPHKEARQFCCGCSNKIFLLDEESWYLAGTIPFYKNFEKLFEQIKKTIPVIYAGVSKEKICFSSQMHQPVIINDFLRELFFKTKIQNSFIQIPNIISLNYMQLEFFDNQVRNFIMEAESNDEIKLNQGFNIRQIIMKLAQENLNIQYIGSFQMNRQQVPFRLTNQYGSLRIDTIEITVLLPQDEHICIMICQQILSGDVAQQLKAFINFKKGQYQITVKVLSSEDSFEIFYSLKS